MKLPMVEERIRGLKKVLDLERVRKTYHNKHVDGSGNFGYVFVTKDGRWYRIDGDYDSDGIVYRLDVDAYGEWRIEDEPILERARKRVMEVL